MKLFIASTFCVVTSSALLALDPPKVVKTSPSFWETNVNAANQKNVSLTFDQPMRSGFSSWLGRSSLAPDSHSSSTLSEDRLTFSLPMSFGPGKVYVFALNEKNIPGVGFQNERGLTLPPHFLVFQTAGAPTADDAPPRIVRATPANGDPQVDPARVRTITLTFDKPMKTDKHGLHVFENNRPIDLSKSPGGYSTDGLTFILPYTFRPSTEYRLELNNVNDIGFARTTRVPLWPVQISFSVP